MPSAPLLPAHPNRPSTNAQRSWTALILGIILYEIDGWGQPLTERVKTTLRCPLWISMMENRLLKKIYVCSPLPQERPPIPSHALTNQTCHCGKIKLSDAFQLPTLTISLFLRCRKQKYHSMEQRRVLISLVMMVRNQSEPKTFKGKKYYKTTSFKKNRSVHL